VLVVSSLPLLSLACVPVPGGLTVIHQHSETGRKCDPVEHTGYFALSEWNEKLSCF
jgi:hypothetical protein